MHNISKIELSDLTLKDNWDYLSSNVSTHDSGQTFTWNKIWWDYYRNSISDKESFILIDKDNNGQVNAIWPFMIRERHGLRRIHWIGQVDGMITDYCGALLTKNSEKCAIAMLKYLSCNKSQWDVIDIFLPQWSDQYQLIISNLIVNEQQLRFNWQDQISDHSSYISLSKSFDDFLASLGKSTRTNIRQYLRKIKNVESHFEILRGKDVLNGLPDLFRLNSENWKVFHCQKECLFHESVVNEMESCGGEFIMPRLTINGVIVAAILGYESGTTCYLHSAGIKREYIAGTSPGLTLHAFLIEDLIKRGFLRLDLSPGLEEYKIRLQSIIEPIYRLLIWHPLSRYRLFKLLEIIRFHLIFRSKPFHTETI